MAEANSSTTFEEAFQRAEKAVEALERGDLSLDDCLKEYEQGFQALKRCYQRLGEAQKRIEVLAEGGALPGAGSSPPAWKSASSVPPLGEALDRIAREQAGSSSPSTDH